MKLIIENLGPIKKGEIDLNKRFYCFVGYNNSGKSYLANVLWKIFDIKEFVHFILIEKVKDNDYEVFDMSAIGITKLLKEYAQYITTHILPELFQVKADNSIVMNCKITFVDWEETYTDSIKAIKNLSVKLWDDKPDIATVSLTQDYKFLWEGIDKIKLNKKDIPNIIGFEAGFVYGSLFRVDSLNLFFLPAERSFYSSFNSYFFRIEQEKKQELDKKLQSLLKNGKTETTDLQKIVDSTKSEYSESMYALLRKYHDLFEGGKLPKRNHYYDTQIAQLEEIMGGKVQIETQDGFPQTRFQHNKGKQDESLEMYLASSSVNQLSALSTYLKYWAQEKGNFLVIDEPEENLHPANVLKLLQILIDFANMNDNTVLITTHSPLLTDAINNQLMLGALHNRESMAQALGFEGTSFLEAKETGIYYFSGNSVLEYSIGEYGTIFKDFKAVVDKIENQQFVLSEALFNQYNTPKLVENDSI